MTLQTTVPQDRHLATKKNNDDFWAFARQSLIAGSTTPARSRSLLVLSVSVTSRFGCTSGHLSATTPARRLNRQRRLTPPSRVRATASANFGHNRSAPDVLIDPGTVARADTGWGSRARTRARDRRHSPRYIVFYNSFTTFFFHCFLRRLNRVGS